MTIPAFVEDGGGSGTRAKVSDRGELVTGKVAFDQSYTVTVDAINTAYNFVGPVSGQQFIVTGILLFANRNVGASDASVQIYEADSASSTTATKTIIDVEMLKQTSRDIIGLNLGITAGKWLNIKTNDDDIFATVFGYYIEI